MSSVPSVGGAIATVFRFEWLRLRRARRFRLGVFAAIAVALATIAARYSGEEVAPDAAFDATVTWGIFRLLVFLVPFLFSANAISEEVEGRTLGFLFGRPVSRAAVIVGKFAVGAVASVVLLSALVTLLFFGVYASTPDQLGEALPALGRLVASMAALGTFYAALCTFWGAVAPRSGGISSLLYLGLVEFVGASMPSYTRCISMNYIGQQLAGLEPGGFFVEMAPQVPPTVAVAVIAAMTFFALGIAVMAASSAEYRQIPS